LAGRERRWGSGGDIKAHSRPRPNLRSSLVVAEITKPTKSCSNECSNADESPRKWAMDPEINPQFRAMKRWTTNDGDDPLST